MFKIQQLNLKYQKDRAMKKFVLMIACLPLLLSGANIFLAGDSTMCIYKETSAPQQGWGMALQVLCKDGVKVFNYAQGGRSSMSFITEKRWERIRREAKKGDFVIIQFGHNDAHRGEKNLYRSTDPQTTFKLYLRLYIAEARARGMIPILCTQTALCIFKNGKTVNKRDTYVNACREIAAETKCALIDLNAYAIEKMTAMGKKEASKFHMIFAPGENPKFPKGRNDVCHLTGAGAKFYAETLVELAKKQNLPIADLFK